MSLVLTVCHLIRVYKCEDLDIFHIIKLHYNKWMVPKMKLNPSFSPKLNHLFNLNWNFHPKIFITNHWNHFSVSSLHLEYRHKLILQKKRQVLAFLELKCLRVRHYQEGLTPTYWKKTLKKSKFDRETQDANIYLLNMYANLIP